MDESRRSKALLAIAKDGNRLIKTNPIINARFDITAVQMKVFLKIIASIDQSQDEIPEISLTVQEIQKFVGKGSKNIHQYLQDELSKLRKKEIHYEDENIKLESSFINTIVYHKKEGRFTFDIPKKIKPFLLQIKDNFTVLDIRNILFLDSIYAIRFYEFCKEFERFRSFEFGVDELKEMFGITDKYKNYYDFKLKVLRQARAELIKNSELYFDFDEIKDGKKVVKIRFTIIKNASKEPQEEDILRNEQIGEIHELVQNYVSLATVQAWFSKYPFEQIKRGVVYVLQQNEKGKVKEVGAYLQKIVSMKDLFDAEQVKKEQTKKKKAEKQQRVEKTQQMQEALEVMKAKAHDQKMALFHQLIKEDESAKGAIVEKLKNGMFKNHYKDDLNLAENLKNPSLAGVMVGIAQSMYPVQFESMKAIEAEIEGSSREQRG